MIESKRDRKSGLLKGISSNYLPVLIEGDDKMKNTIANVEIVKLERNNLIGNFSTLKKMPSDSVDP